MEIGFLWIGLIFVWIGALIVRFATREFSGAQRVDGEVIGYGRETDQEGSQSYLPVVAFVHPVAGRRVLKSSFGAGNILYPVGTSVKVLVNVQDPTFARIDTKGFLYFGLLFMAIGLGACALFFAIFSWTRISIILAVLFSAALVWQARKQRESFAKLASLGKVMDRTLGGGVVDERAFDRSQLVSSEELAGTHRRTARQSVIAGTLMLIMGIGGLVGTWFWTERRQSFIGRAVAAEGRVVELAVSSDSDSTMSAPVVEFTPQNAARPVRFRHSVSSSHPSYKIGEAVRVLHDPLEPSSAMIDQGWWTTAMPLIPGAVGCIFAALGLYSISSGLRHDRLPTTRRAGR